MRQRSILWWSGRLPADGWLVFVAHALRVFAFGYFSVQLGLYLASLGYDRIAIGLFLSLALVGSAGLSILL